MADSKEKNKSLEPFHALWRQQLLLTQSNILNVMHLSSARDPPPPAGDGGDLTRVWGGGGQMDPKTGQTKWSNSPTPGQGTSDMFEQLGPI